MKIIILDGAAENPGDLSWEPLRAFGELTVYDRTEKTDEAVIARIQDAQIVITNKTPITRKVIDACPTLALICVLATGTDVVDLEYAREKNIPVCNVPAYGSEVVSQAAIALLLEVCHHVGEHNRSVHEGRWEQCPDFCYWEYPIIELKDKTMGIIGLGRIGRRTAAIAAALGMEVVAYDPFPGKTPDPAVRYVSLDVLWGLADVIVLHAPATKEDYHLICRESIQKMKDGVIIINNSRGSLIQEADLAEALRSGKVYGAAVDVVSREPIAKDNPLLTAPNCIITPHISWAAREARQRILDTTVENVRSFLQGQPGNRVN
jgi:glycerate dehydrogenase